MCKFKLQTLTKLSYKLILLPLKFYEFGFKNSAATIVKMNRVISSSLTTEEKENGQNTYRVVGNNLICYTSLINLI